MTTFEIVLLISLLCIAGQLAIISAQLSSIKERV